MSFDEQLERAFDNLTDRLTTEVAHQVRVVVDDVAAAWRAEQEHPTRAVTAGEAEAIERLASGVRAIGAASSLSGVLDALLDAASHEASRVGIFLVQGERFRGWRTFGFGPAWVRGDDIEIGTADAGILADAVRTRAMTTTTRADLADVPTFAHLTNGQAAVAIPLAMAGQVVAVLYADHVSSATHALDLLATHAARCLESRTAVQFAQALTDSAAPIATPSVDEDAAAQRYARLLVSEIKLYHEAAVVAGRRDGTLGARLAAEIERARALYEQRVAGGGGATADYFQAELVRTLADGDASALNVKSVEGEH